MPEPEITENNIALTKYLRESKAHSRTHELTSTYHEIRFSLPR